MNRKKRIIQNVSEIVFGFLAAAAAVWGGFYVIAYITDGGDIEEEAGNILFLCETMAVPLAVIWLAFGKMAADEKWKYVAVGALAVIGALGSFFLGIFAGTVWGIAYAALLLGLLSFGWKRDSGRSGVMGAFWGGLFLGGIIWKVMEFIRGGAIYPILAVEWLMAAFGAWLTRKNVFAFSVVAATVIFLWYAVLSDPCGYYDYLRW